MGELVHEARSFDFDCFKKHSMIKTNHLHTYYFNLIHLVSLPVVACAGQSQRKWDPMREIKLENFRYRAYRVTYSEQITTLTIPLANSFLKYSINSDSIRYQREIKFPLDNFRVIYNSYYNRLLTYHGGGGLGVLR